VPAHLSGDRCAISPGDIQQLYLEMYKDDHIADISSFRFTVLIDDHAFSLQITDAQAFEAFAQEHGLSTTASNLNNEMLDYFKDHGINVEKEIANPTKTASECTDMFIRFFTEQNSGLSFSKGTYSASGQPVWQAQRVQNSTVQPRCS
jgi:hypothetical protein